MQIQKENQPKCQNRINNTKTLNKRVNLKPVQPIHLFMAVISLFASHSCLFAQSKTMTLKTDQGVGFYKVEPSGDNQFMVVYGKALLSKKAKKNVTKFNQDLEPVWKQPVFYTGVEIGAYNTSIYAKTMAFSHSNTTDKTTFSYTNPADNTTFDYLFGMEQFVQIRPDGSVKEQLTAIPKKEAEKIAAVFTDAKGLNVLTITGDKKFPTGSMNWYTFSHENLSLTKREITLSVPPNSEEIDNSDIQFFSRIVLNSGWRLNEATATGLYFYCGVDKKDPNSKSKSSFSTYVVPVDPTGKAGAIISLDQNVIKHQIYSLNYQQDEYSALKVIHPPLYEWNLISEGTSSKVVSIASENAYLGIKIDANSKKIYTAIAFRRDSVAGKGGLSIERVEESVAYLVFNTYDFEGQKIAGTRLQCELPELEKGDAYKQKAYQVEIIPLSNGEGVLCKLMRNGNGLIWAFNDKGERIQELKIKRSAYKALRSKYYFEFFSVPHSSLQDFRNSPYVLKEKSPANRFFQALTDDEKKAATYHSLKDYELVSVWNSKKGEIKFYSFNKQ
ncbi:hypothetical protein [Haliscomenobacter sp.]|uniref:hypothetical protein n=1 Tax=Haliscomenobacter sp. TaxID=2717303 RepID=UPI003364DF07